MSDAKQEWIDKFKESLDYHCLYFRQAVEFIGKRSITDTQYLEHDFSKWSDDELPHYARNFFGDKGDPDGFAKAWLHHIHKNPHHWQHWIFPGGYELKGSDIFHGIVPMPENYALEMIADWLGSSKAYTGSFDMSDWLSKNVHKIILHPVTADFVMRELDMLGYADIVYGREIIFGSGFAYAPDEYSQNVMVKNEQE